MSSLRKLAIVSLFCLGLLLSTAAAPASAKTFYGDLYLGFSITGLTSAMPQGFDLNALMSQGQAPFRGKVYYQDGFVRLDIDLPNMQELAAAKDSKAVKSFEVFTVLLNTNSNEYILLNHSLRQALRLSIPADLMGPNPYKDPFALLTSTEFKDGMKQGGLKYLSTKRIKSRTFEGLKANGIELQAKMELPKDQTSQLEVLGVDFNGLLKLRYYYEAETKFPLQYEMDSSIMGLTLQLVNIKRDRLPEVMFEIPSFYTVREYTLEDIEQLLMGLASSIPEVAGKMESKLAVPPTAPPEAKGEDAAASGDEATAGNESETPGTVDNNPADAPPGSMNT
jgi:hypothetical protein